MQIILASQSKARRALMKQLEILFECHISEFPEDMTLYKSPARLAKYLAFGKANHIKHLFPNSIIIGADTFILNDTTKVGKPKNLAEARKIIQAMSGKTIKVISGVATIKTNHQAEIIQQDIAAITTKLKIKKMSPQEIEHLATQEEALQISGAFSIEGEGGRMVEKITGDFNNVIGLPLFHLRNVLPKFGIKL